MNSQSISDSISKENNEDNVRLLKEVAEIKKLTAAPHPVFIQQLRSKIEQIKNDPGQDQLQISTVLTTLHRIEKNLHSRPIQLANDLMSNSIKAPTRSEKRKMKKANKRGNLPNPPIAPLPTSPIQELFDPPSSPDAPSWPPRHWIQSRRPAIINPIIRQMGRSPPLRVGPPRILYAQPQLSPHYQSPVPRTPPITHPLEETLNFVSPHDPLLAPITPPSPPIDPPHPPLVHISMGRYIRAPSEAPPPPPISTSSPVAE